MTQEKTGPQAGVFAPSPWGLRAAAPKVPAHLWTARREAASRGFTWAGWGRRRIQRRLCLFWRRWPPPQPSPASRGGSKRNYGFDSLMPRVGLFLRSKSVAKTGGAWACSYDFCHSARSRGIHAAVDEDAPHGLLRLRFAPRRMTTYSGQQCTCAMGMAKEKPRRARGPQNLFAAASTGKGEAQGFTAAATPRRRS